MKEDAEERLHMIQKFKQSLEESEWLNHLSEVEKEKKKEAHEEFCKRIEKDRWYDKEVYAMEKILSHNDRIREKKSQLAYEEQLILKERDEVMKNLEYLAQCELRT